MRYQFLEELRDKVDFGEMDDRFFLIGLLNEFMNRFQTVGDRFSGEISWKQCFTLICIQFFKEPPALKDLSQLMGSSHQNVKQMLLKLEKSGFVRLVPDDFDKRKQRIVLTEKAAAFCRQHDKPSINYVGKLFESVDEEALKITVQTLIQLDTQLQEMQKSGALQAAFESES